MKKGQTRHTNPSLLSAPLPRDPAVDPVSGAIQRFPRYLSCYTTASAFRVSTQSINSFVSRLNIFLRS